MEISVPSLLRIKKDALNKIGKYLRNGGHREIALFFGEGIRDLFYERINISLQSSEIDIIHEEIVRNNDIEDVFASSFSIPSKVKAIVAVGGGKAIDYCKYIAFISHLPIISIPTSMSNDGFASPLSSLYVKGRRRSLKTVIPNGVIVDTGIISNAPERFLYSGLGDLISNITALQDWKLAFHKNSEPVNDFAALVSSNAVENMINSTEKEIRNPDFLKIIAGSLVMSGVSMEICQSSRPSSGSDHLISHAYDLIAEPPSLHGIQVGLATYCVSHVQENRHNEIKAFLQESGFFDFVRKNPLDGKSFLTAVDNAPSMKENFYTVLSEKENREKAKAFIETDPVMKSCLK